MKWIAGPLTHFFGVVEIEKLFNDAKTRILMLSEVF